MDNLKENMMRLILISLFATVAMVFAATTASAVEVALETSATITVAPGGSFTIELAVDNASASPNNGILVDITGLAGVADATSGVAAFQYFTGFCSPTQCFGGYNANNNLFYNNGDLVNGAANGYSAGDDSIRTVSALNLADVNTTGAGDPGLAGIFGSHDSTDVSVVFQAIGAPGTYELLVEASWNSAVTGETVLAPIAISLTIVPEPGTALLMGLGLAGLAAAGRRK